MGKDQVFPHLNKLGIDIKQLESGINPCLHEIPGLINGAVCELSKMSLNWPKITEILQTWMGPRYPSPYFGYRRVYGVVNKLNKEKLSLIKRKKTPANLQKTEHFMEEIFSIPLHLVTEAGARKNDDPYIDTLVNHVSPGPLTCKQIIESLKEELEDNKKQLNNLKERIKNQQKNDRKKIGRRESLLMKKAHTIRSNAITMKKMEASRRRSRDVAHRRLQLLQKAKCCVKLQISACTQTARTIPECSQCLRYEDHIERVTVIEPGERRVSVFETKNTNAYKPAVIQCILNLLEKNVSYAHIGPVMGHVLAMVNILSTNLPSPSGVAYIAELRLPLSHINIAETIANEPNTTLGSDETRKRGLKLETYVLTANDSKKVLAVREITDKSAETNVSTLKDVIDDLNAMSSQSAGVGSNILTQIKNTMSDRACSEKKFHDLLQTYRLSVLPEVWPHWEQLSEERKNEIGTVHNFYCGLHLLVNAAECVSVTLTEFEKLHTPSSAGRNSESRCTNMIRCVCKGFAKGGDEKNGCYDMASVFFKAKGIKLNFTPFRGNRFNILFHNGALVYYHHSILIEFLETCTDSRNRLLEEILNALHEPYMLAGCRALGILDKILTKPLWNLLEREGSILAMNNVYARLIEQLQSVEPTELVNAKTTLFSNHCIDQDDVYTVLTTPSENDCLTSLALEYLLKDLASLFTRLLKDQLPGGMHFSKTTTTNPECSSVPKHNKLPESVFGKSDFLITSKPSIKPTTIGGAILYQFNKVSEWINSMDATEFTNYLQKASSLRRLNWAEQKIRLAELQHKKLQLLQDKRAAIEKRKQNKLKEKTTLTNAIIHHGLWQTQQQVEQMLQTYDKAKDKLQAVKSQLKLRKNVLRQKVCDPSIYLFSKNKKPLPLEGLVKNLTTLIIEAGDMVPGSCDQSPLVQKKVLHTFTETDGHDKDYVGTVISQVPGFSEWFNMVYDEEPDTVYTYKLREDVESGCLKVIE